MLHRIRERLTARDTTGGAAGDPSAAPELAPLRLLAAPMLLLTGFETTLDSLSRSAAVGAGEEARGRASYAAVLAPSLLAPLAAAAQVARVTRPSPRVSVASRVLNVAVMGAGAAAVTGMLAGRHERAAPVSLAPLALAAAGVLGLVLDRQEGKIEEERRRLERRARVVERLVPRRRGRLERIVVHV